MRRPWLRALSSRFICTLRLPRQGRCAQLLRLIVSLPRQPAHNATAYKHWYGTTVPYEVDYQYLYEPYVALDLRRAPRFDISFNGALAGIAPAPPAFSSRRAVTLTSRRTAGYGHDKASHAYELAARGYRFVVHPQAFIVHMHHDAASWAGEVDLGAAWRKCVRSCAAQRSLLIRCAGGGRLQKKCTSSTASRCRCRVCTPALCCMPACRSLLLLLLCPRVADTVAGHCPLLLSGGTRA